MKHFFQVDRWNFSANQPRVQLLSLRQSLQVRTDLRLFVRLGVLDNELIVLDVDVVTVDNRGKVFVSLLALSALYSGQVIALADERSHVSQIVTRLFQIVDALACIPVSCDWWRALYFARFSQCLTTATFVYH